MQAYTRFLAKQLFTVTDSAYRDKYFANIVFDPEFGLIEHLDATTLICNPHMFKAKAAKDPYTPIIDEAMTRPHRMEFLEAMAKEIDESKKHDTWEVIKRSSIQPVNGQQPNIIPST